MRYKLLYSKKFNKQYERLLRSGNERIIKELRKTIRLLGEGVILEVKYHNHRLVGEMKNDFECHVLPDWLLIYRKYDDLLILEFVATGTHSELF